MASVEKLKSQVYQLLPGDQSTADTYMKPLLDTTQHLSGALESLKMKRQNFLDQCETYHDRHLAVSQDIEKINNNLDSTLIAQNLTLTDKIDQLQVTKLQLIILL